MERESCRCRKGSKDEAIAGSDWQAEAETVEVIAAVEEEEAKTAKFTDEELEAQALAAQAAEGGDEVVPAEEARRWKRSFRNRKNRLRRFAFARLKRSLLKPKRNLGSGLSVCSAAENRR